MTTPETSVEVEGDRRRKRSRCVSRRSRSATATALARVALARRAGDADHHCGPAREERDAGDELRCEGEREPPPEAEHDEEDDGGHRVEGVVEGRGRAFDERGEDRDLEEVGGGGDGESEGLALARNGQRGVRQEAEKPTRGEVLIRQDGLP